MAGNGGRAAAILLHDDTADIAAFLAQTNSFSTVKAQRIGSRTQDGPFQHILYLFLIVIFRKSVFHYRLVITILIFLRQRLHRQFRIRIVLDHGFVVGGFFDSLRRIGISNCIISSSDISFRIVFGKYGILIILRGNFLISHRYIING